jgi:hypothetical protein
MLRTPPNVSPEGKALDQRVTAGQGSAPFSGSSCPIPGNHPAGRKAKRSISVTAGQGSSRPIPGNQPADAQHGLRVPLSHAQNFSSSLHRVFR